MRFYGTSISDESQASTGARTHAREVPKRTQGNKCAFLDEHKAMEGNAPPGGASNPHERSPSQLNQMRERPTRSEAAAGPAEIPGAGGRPGRGGRASDRGGGRAAR